MTVTTVTQRRFLSVIYPPFQSLLPILPYRKNFPPELPPCLHRLVKQHQRNRLAHGNAHYGRNPYNRRAEQSPVQSPPRVAPRPKWTRCANLRVVRFPKLWKGCKKSPTQPIFGSGRSAQSKRGVDVRALSTSNCCQITCNAGYWHIRSNEGAVEATT